MQKITLSRTAISSGSTITKVSGRLVFTDVLELLKLIRKDCRLGRCYEIVRFESGAQLDITFEEASVLIDNIRPLLDDMHRVIIAFVADNDLLFGFSRQIEFLLEDGKHILIDVFRDENSAHAWMCKMRGTSG